MKKIWLLTVLALLLVFLPGCMYLIRYDGAYRGRVVDEETREPIEGAVVLGVWYKEWPTVAGTVGTYYDAKETLTTKNGAFEIPGQGLRVMTDLTPIRIQIFKVGYTYVSAHWVALDKGVWLKNKVTWEGGKPVIPLRKLTVGERNDSFTLPHYPQPEIQLEHKAPLWMREVDKERSEREQVRR